MAAVSDSPHPINSAESRTEPWRQSHRNAAGHAGVWSMSSLLGPDTTVLVFEVYWCQFRLFRSAFHGY